MFRRRRLPHDLVAAHEAFDSVIPPLERAKAALTSSVPGTRLPGRPLAETLLEFEEELAHVREGMPAWRAPAVEDVWVSAHRGLGESLAAAERLRLGGAPCFSLMAAMRSPFRIPAMSGMFSSPASWRSSASTMPVRPPRLRGAGAAASVLTRSVSLTDVLPDRPGFVPWSADSHTRPDGAPGDMSVNGSRELRPPRQQGGRSARRSRWKAARVGGGFWFRGTA
jgi:hypothetical protein